MRTRETGRSRGVGAVAIERTRSNRLLLTLELLLQFCGEAGRCVRAPMKCSRGVLEQLDAPVRSLLLGHQTLIALTSGFTRDWPGGTIPATARSNAVPGPIARTSRTSATKAAGRWLE